MQNFPHIFVQMNTPRFTQGQLTAFFRAVVDIFFQRESDNILTGVSERNLCGRLAMYLENNFSSHQLTGDYFADTEYNRKQNGEIKTIINDQEKVIKISADVLVHSRGLESPDNLITIEMKKSDRSPLKRYNDRLRLRALTKKNEVWGWNGTVPQHVSGYILGFYMELNHSTRTCLIEKYKGGDKIDDWTQEF